MPPPEPPLPPKPPTLCAKMPTASCPLIVMVPLLLTSTEPPGAVPPPSPPSPASPLPAPPLPPLPPTLCAKMPSAEVPLVVMVGRTGDMDGAPPGRVSAFTAVAANAITGTAIAAVAANRLGEDAVGIVVVRVDSAGAVNRNRAALATVAAFAARADGTRAVAARATVAAAADRHDTLAATRRADLVGAAGIGDRQVLPRVSGMPVVAVLETVASVAAMPLKIRQRNAGRAGVRRDVGGEAVDVERRGRRIGRCGVVRRRRKTAGTGDCPAHVGGALGKGRAGFMEGDDGRRKANNRQDLQATPEPRRGVSCRVTGPRR